MRDLWKGVAIVGIWVGIGIACKFVGEAAIMLGICAVIPTIVIAAS